MYAKCGWPYLGYIANSQCKRMCYNGLPLVCPDTCCSIYNHPHQSRNASQHKWVSRHFLMMTVTMYIMIMLLYLPVLICLNASTSMCWIQFVLVDTTQCSWHSCFIITRKLLGVYWFHSARPSVCLSILPSIHLSVPHSVSTLAPGWIHFIFIHLIKQHQVCCV